MAIAPAPGLAWVPLLGRPARAPGVGAMAAAADSVACFKVASRFLRAMGAQWRGAGSGRRAAGPRKRKKKVFGAGLHLWGGGL